jgi:hypothetical protein
MTDFKLSASLEGHDDDVSATPCVVLCCSSVACYCFEVCWTELHLHRALAIRGLLYDN